MKAIQVHESGGPDVLQLDTMPEPEPGAVQVRVRIEWAGVNFIDTYQRSGAFPMALPYVPGSEAAGAVDALGPGVDDLSLGQRVAFAQHLGAYAEAAVVPRDRVVAVPANVATDTAAAVLLQGMTAHMLAVSTYPLGPGDTALVYAAAGGVGHLLVQIAKRRGARVIAATSTPEKAELARSDGADDVVLYRDEDLVDAVRDLTDGRGVDVVYDSVGRDTFDSSLRVLRERGYLVLYGQASGFVDAVDPRRLSEHGSLFLSRPTLANYASERTASERGATVLAWLARDQLRVRVDRRWPLADAAESHRYMEEGRTRGKLLLHPSRR